MFLAAFALVAPSVACPAQHRRLMQLIRWLVILIVALMGAVLAARLPMATVGVTLLL